MNPQMGQQGAPVKAGEIHEVSIESVGEKGDGIARVKGFVIFVPGVKKGDYVKVKITKVLAKVGFAEVIGQLEKLPQSSSRFATFKKEDLERREEEPEQRYEDSESFGEEEQQ